MTRHRTQILAPLRRRRLVSLTLMVALVINTMMPLAQAIAGPSGTHIVLGAICSPNGVRYVEMDLGPAESEAPHAPGLGSLDHCPGCLGATAAVLPEVASVPHRLADDRSAPASIEQAKAPLPLTRFQPRAPPHAS